MIEEASGDYNGDGKIVISSDFISLTKGTDETGQGNAPDFTGGQQEMASAMKLMTVISAGADPIYLLDSYAYERITAMGSDEESRSDIFGSYSVPVESLKGEGVSGFAGMRFYLRASHADEAYYEYCMKLLKNIDRSWNNASG